MSQPNFVTVTDQDGLRGTIDTTTPAPDSDGSQVRVLMEAGEVVLVPLSLLIARDESHYDLPVSLRSFSSQAAQDDETIVIPVIEETLDVQKRRVETGRVRLTKTVQERQERVDEPLLREEVSVERVPVGRVVTEPVPVRYEGETMIVSLLEEQLVVEKRLVVTEELRITRRQTETHQPQDVTLRREEVAVERVAAETAAA